MTFKSVILITVTTFELFPLHRNVSLKLTYVISIKSTGCKSILDKHFTMAALLEECKTDLGFKGCEKSLRAILQKQLGFVFKKVDNKLKLEQKKVVKKRTRSPKDQKSSKKTKKTKQNCVPVQTQTLQTGPVPDMTMGHNDRTTTIDHMGTTMHT